MRLCSGAHNLMARNKNIVVLTVTMAETIASITPAIALITLLIAPPIAEKMDP